MRPAHPLSHQIHSTSYKLQARRPTRVQYKSSLMSQHGASLIRLLQIQNIFFCQLDINAICKQKFNPHRHVQSYTQNISRTNQILEFLDTRTANDWCRDSGQRPRQRDLRHAYAVILGYLFDPNRILTKLFLRPRRKNGPLNYFQSTGPVQIAGEAGTMDGVR